MYMYMYIHTCTKCGNLGVLFSGFGQTRDMRTTARISAPDVPSPLQAEQNATSLCSPTRTSYKNTAKMQLCIEAPAARFVWEHPHQILSGQPMLVRVVMAVLPSFKAGRVGCIYSWSRGISLSPQ